MKMYFYSIIYLFIIYINVTMAWTGRCSYGGKTIYCCNTVPATDSKLGTSLKGTTCYNLSKLECKMGFLDCCGKGGTCY